MPEEPDRPRAARGGNVADEPPREHQEWGASTGLGRERSEPPPGIPEGEPSLSRDWGASADLAGERSEPPPGVPPEGHGIGERERHPSRRPVDVDERNRPPGDPGPRVDVQDLVGGQPGRPDPGPTGGPAREAVGAVGGAEGRTHAPAERKYRRRERGS